MRVVSWNLNGNARHKRIAEALQYLDTLEPDIALLQEVAPLPEGISGLWQPVWSGKWGTAIVARKGLVLRELPSIPVTSIDAIPDGHLERSHPGAWVAADVETQDLGAITVVSVYGLMRRLRNGVDYATTTVHRTLSDLTPVLDVRRSKGKVVLAGDLNVSPQIEPPDREAHTATIARLKAFGLIDCLGAKHDAPVQTYRHHNKPGGKPWQLDWMFAAPSLQLASCEVVDTPQVHALSDHNPVLAVFAP
jgi:endonuclease/exonuclease/phosphatase family metal-dependent hydrolase